mmetsp:Transcript_89657/g.187266  ORF Transcript_89657/g.187266 Transcript_89657/m.187266 type:complete len:135 (+) Transcript_89657:564-968(+)
MFRARLFFADRFRLRLFSEPTEICPGDVLLCVGDSSLRSVSLSRLCLTLGGVWRGSTGSSDCGCGGGASKKEARGSDSRANTRRLDKPPPPPAVEGGVNNDEATDRSPAVLEGTVFEVEGLVDSIALPSLDLRP